MYISVFVFRHVYIHMYIHIHMYLSYMCIYMYIYIYTYMYLLYMCIYAITYSNTYMGIHVCIMNVCIDYDTLYVIACRSVYTYTQICGKICIERIVAEVFNDSNIVWTWHLPRRNEGYRDSVVMARRYTWINVHVMGFHT